MNSAVYHEFVACSSFQVSLFSLYISSTYYFLLKWRIWKLKGKFKLPRYIKQIPKKKTFSSSYECSVGRIKTNGRS